jgi:hypothetical protein
MCSISVNSQTIIFNEKVIDTYASFEVDFSSLSEKVDYYETIF